MIEIVDLFAMFSITMCGAALCLMAAIMAAICAKTSDETDDKD